MKGFEDVMRSFGMSGLLIAEEIRNIEGRFGVGLGSSQIAKADAPVDYYPQFEASVRAEAAEMARHYEVFYCLENAIRKLIAETLQDSYGSTWWEGGKVPQKIVDGVKERIQREVDSGMTRRSDQALDYTNFGELSIIISSNWQLFSTILSSQRAVERVMNNLNLLRAPIAHCCPISEDEITRLNLAVKDWFRMLG